MKITKRQLKRIIKEEKARLMEYGGRPYDPTRPGDYERYRDNPTGDAPPGGVQDDGGSDPVEDYVAWAEENGHVTPSASSVVASYIVEDPKREAYKVMIADAFGMMVSEITREVERQQAEKAVTMGESKMKITKRQLKRIIKEEKVKLLEQPAVSDDYLKGIVKGTASPGAGSALRDLHNAIDKLITAMGPDEAAAELEGIAEEIRMGMV